MTEYEFNKQTYLNLPELNKDAIELAFKQVDEFLQRDNHKIYMLLSNEKRDYTVFLKQIKNRTVLLDGIKDVILSRGKLKGINVANRDIDFWIENNSECYLYKLFDYTWGVIKC